MTIRKEYARFLEERLAPSKVDIPGFSPGCVAVRLLTDSQATEAKVEAFKHVEKLCKEAGIAVSAFDAADPEALERERQIQMVYRAFVDGEAEADDDDPNLAFRSAAQVRDLDSVTIDLLFDTYLAFQTSKVARAEFDPTTLDDLLSGLREDGSEGVLATLDAAQLRMILVAVARRG